MTLNPSQKLINLTTLEPDTSGVSFEAAGKIPLNDEVRQNILACLYDTSPDEIGWGLWFSEALMAVERLDTLTKAGLMKRLPALLDSTEYGIREAAVRNLVLLKKETGKNYREWMLKCLCDPCHGVRQVALLTAHTFLTRDDVDVLLKFKSDPYYAETSMMGPLVYILRNEALSQIERILKKDFGKTYNSEIIEGKRIQWRDWSAFIKWWTAPWRRLLNSTLRIGSASSGWAATST